MIYYAHTLPKLGIYECIYMRCRTAFDNKIVINNDNVAYIVSEKEYDKLFLNMRGCDDYLK